MPNNHSRTQTSTNTLPWPSSSSRSASRSNSLYPDRQQHLSLSPQAAPPFFVPTGSNSLQAVPWPLSQTGPPSRPPMSSPHAPAGNPGRGAASASGPGAGRGALRGPRSLFVYLALAVSLVLNAACLEHVFGGARLLPLLGFLRTSGTEGVLSSRASAEGQDSVGQANPDDPFAFPGVDACGLWAPNYTRLHSEILSKQRPQKFITLLASGPGGDIGASLMGVVSVFLAALLTDRALLITDPNVLDAFHPAGVDWQATAGVPMTATAGERGKMPEAAAAVEGSVLFLDLRNDPSLTGARAKEGLVRFPEHIVEFFAPFRRAENILMEADGGVLAKIFGFNSRTFRELFYTWGFRLPTAFGCILRFLMRPKAEVLSLIQEPLAALRIPSARAVCVGLQGTAGISESDLGHALSALLGCATNIQDYWFPPAWKVFWLVSTDSESMAALASALVPADKLVLLSNVTRAEGGTGEGAGQLRSRAAEWLLFAQCQYYAFADSSFCKASFGYNIGAPLMFQFPPPTEPPKAACEASHGHSLLSLRQWHGL